MAQITEIMTCTRLRIAHAGRLAALLLPGLAVAAGLNDTGVTQCANLTQNNQACPQAGFPSQDADTGRNAQAGLSKAGGGSAGFDFTKLDNNGNPLDASTTSWDCVRDNCSSSQRLESQALRLYQLAHAHP
jgi:hypothetical protein